MTVHAEMGPRITFCVKYPPQLPPEDQTVSCNDWYQAPEVIQHVTCEQCLMRIFMLGDSASIALGRMGRRVEVKDDPGSEAVS